jgi:hypothetical protein
MPSFVSISSQLDVITKILQERLIPLHNNFVDSSAVRILRESNVFNPYEAALPLAVATLHLHQIPEGSGLDRASAMMICLPRDVSELHLLAACHTRRSHVALPEVDVVAVLRGLVPLFGSVPRLSFNPFRTPFRFQSAVSTMSPTHAAQDARAARLDFVWVSKSSRLRDLATDMASRMGGNPLSGESGRTGPRATIAAHVFNDIMKPYKDQASLDKLQQALTVLATTVLKSMGRLTPRFTPETRMEEVLKESRVTFDSRFRAILSPYLLAVLPDFLQVHLFRGRSSLVC